MLYKGKLDQIIMCLYVEVICKIQTMYVTNLRSGLEYIVKEQNDLAKDYYKKVSAKYCYVTHELRLHRNDRCKRFTLF